MAGADHLQFAAFRLGLSARIPRRVADRRRGAAPLRRFLHGRIDRAISAIAAFRRCGSTFPRSYVDVNREPYELDPRMFAGRLPSFANTRSMRVAGGLGTIPRVVGDGQEIYRERLSVDDGAGADRGAVQALSPRAAPADQQGASGVRHRDPGGLPFDAVGRRHRATSRGGRTS